MERQPVPCGKCENCVKNRKQMWTGKLVAEAETSMSVAFLTLTYAKEPESFVYRDVQLMLKRYRKHMAAKHRTRVRFFCVGERGDVNGRIHWHLILFFNKTTWVEPPAMNTHWRFWSHGWTQVQNLRPDSLRTKKIRYCVMYAVKGFSDRNKDLPRPRFSVGSLDEPYALGGEYIVNLAADMGQKGIVPDGTYTLPGVVYEKGQKAGQFQRFPLAGACRRIFVEVWRQSWIDRYGSDNVPVNDWLLRYDKDGLHPIFTDQKKHLLPAGQVRAGRISVVEPEGSVEMSGKSEDRYLTGPGWSLHLQVATNGRATLYDFVTDTRYEIGRSISDVLDLPADLVLYYDKWLSMVRGPNWVFNDGEETKETECISAALVGCRDADEYAAWLDRNYADYLADRDRATTGRPIRKDATRSVVATVETKDPARRRVFSLPQGAGAGS